MKECSKSIQRRIHTPGFMRRFFVGDGLDVGGKPDPLAIYKYLFPGMRSCRTWDREDGDAQYLAGVPDGKFDFVHSSHCLEHMEDPHIALENWLRVSKPGGYATITWCLMKICMNRATGRAPLISSVTTRIFVSMRTTLAPEWIPGTHAATNG